MRFLLDTNILIPLEDSNIPLPPGLGNFVRLAQEHGHPLVFHPASEEDINRDRDAERRMRTRDPVIAPDETPADLSSFEYFRRYFPHFRHDENIRKFIIPIRPEYHRILFSDYFSPSDPPQMTLFNSSHTASNAIKQAYLCHAQLGQISPGDVVLFYRSIDEKAVTSIGVVERYETLGDANEIVDRVRRRTVYSMSEIQRMAVKPTKVMLFRLVKHFVHPPSFDWLTQNRVVNGSIQTIREIDDDAYQRLISQAT